MTLVDDEVHIDRPGIQAMKEWSTEPAGADTSPRHVNSVDATVGQPMIARVMARKDELQS